MTRPLVFLWGFRLRKQWPCQLLAQSRVWQILYPIALRIGSGDFRGAEQDVPKEQQISEIAFVVYGWVAVVATMMGMMCRWRRDRPFNNPHDGRKPFDFEQLRIPSHIAMCTNDNKLFDNNIASINPTQAHVDQRCREPDAWHQRVIKNIVPVDQPDAHIAGVVVRTVHIVEPREAMRCAVLPILHHVIQDQEQSDRQEYIDTRQHPTPFGTQRAERIVDKY